jgi:hypothetical protein
MTMPRPSLVTSSGPSPVRGFIAAILYPLSSAAHRAAGFGIGIPGTARAAAPASAVEPASHNRFYPSPYYPVFGTRMVMIGHPARAESAPNGLFTRGLGDYAGASGAAGGEASAAPPAVAPTVMSMLPTVLMESVVRPAARRKSC